MTEDNLSNLKILDQMPYPLAHLYAEMLEEVDPRLRFCDLIRVFVSSLKYLSLVCIADYLQNPDSNQVNATLSSTLKRPSLRHWMLFLHAIIAYYREKQREFHVQELKSVLSHRTNKLMDHMIHLRNAYLHPDEMLRRDESKKLYEETLPHLQTLLSTFSFMARYPLIHRDTETNKEGSVMGSRIELSRSGSFRFLVRTPSGVDLDITPFMLITVDRQYSDLLVYENLIGGDRAKYIMGDHVKFVASGGEADNRVRLLQDLIRKFVSEEETEREKERSRVRRELREGLQSGTLRPKNLRDLAASFSQPVTEEYENLGRSNPQVYVPRRGIEKAYDELLDGEKNGLIIVAESGAGKSTEICQLYRERFEDDISWVISGRKTRARSTLREITRTLFGEWNQHPDLSLVLVALDRTRKTERFVILVDGINETDDPLAAFEQLDEFIRANPYPWLKVVITCRSYTWKTIENSDVVPDRRRYVLSADGAIAHILQPFTDDELRKALDHYSWAFNVSYPSRWAAQEDYDYHQRKFLRSPLILRLIFETSSGHDIQTLPNLDTLMQEFTRERLREKRDLPFLQKYFMTYCYLEETDVLDTRRLLDARSEKALEPADRLIYNKLVEHVCGEQVYHVDEVWHCSSEGCEYGSRPVLVEDEGKANCPLCGLSLQRENVDNRSTYSRLLSENILSQTETSDHVLLRLVFDLFFEHLMARFCFVERMKESYNPTIVTELFQKATRNGIFVEPLKAVLLRLWQQGHRAPVYQVADWDELVSYHIIRELFEEIAVGNFPEFASAVRLAAKETGFNVNVCRAGVHGMLIDAYTATKHVGEIVELLIFLSRCPSERVHEDVGEYLVRLRRSQIDIFTPLINQCGSRLAHLRVLSLVRMVAKKGKHQELKGIISLLKNVVLFGLGNFYQDDGIRGAVKHNGLAIIRPILHHPLLSLFEKFLIRRFLSSWVVKIYKEKGNYACNYFEMLIQLRGDPEAIRRAGDLFFEERKNVFDGRYDEFVRAIHSENGLVSWYSLISLPVHYISASDRDQAVDYMRRLLKEGTEMDRYVVGKAVVILLKRRPEECSKALEEILEDLGQICLENSSQTFLHPEPAPAIPESKKIAAYNREFVQRLRLKSEPYALPWIAHRAGSLHRFYINTVFFEFELLRARRERLNKFTDILDILDHNVTGDVLRFDEDFYASRRFVLCSLIRSLAITAGGSHLDAVLTTMRQIIKVYIEEARDPENIEVYKAAVVAALREIKGYHGQRVLAFVDRFDLGREEYAFLSELKTATEKKDELFSKSLLGQYLYEEALFNKDIRTVFGEATKRAAAGRNVEDFIFIYASSYLKWLKDYPA